MYRHGFLRERIEEYPLLADVRGTDHVEGAVGPAPRQRESFLGLADMAAEGMSPAQWLDIANATRSKAMRQVEEVK